ncbi:MAG: hypothetical protein ACQERC_13570 [Bacteroidota bacterium]
MIVRFIIYGVVIFLLLYWMMRKSNEQRENRAPEQIEIDDKNIGD